MDPAALLANCICSLTAELCHVYRQARRLFQGRWCQWSALATYCFTAYCAHRAATCRSSPVHMQTSGAVTSPVQAQAGARLERGPPQRPHSLQVYICGDARKHVVKRMNEPPCSRVASRTPELDRLPSLAGLAGRHGSDQRQSAWHGLWAALRADSFLGLSIAKAKANAYLALLLSQNSAAFSTKRATATRAHAAATLPSEPEARSRDLQGEAARGRSPPSFLAAFDAWSERESFQTRTGRKRQRPWQSSRPLPFWRMLQPPLDQGLRTCITCKAASVPAFLTHKRRGQCAGTGGLCRQRPGPLPMPRRKLLHLAPWHSLHLMTLAFFT